MKKIIFNYQKVLLSQGYERHKGTTLSPLFSDENFITLSDGTLKFADIDYSCTDHAIWQPYSHLSRIETLLLSKDENTRELIFKLLKFWLNNDFCCPNWWYNEIGVPMLLADITVLLYDVLDNELKKKLYERIARGVVYENTDLKSRAIYTGANLLWFSSTTLVYALLTENASLLRYIIETAAKETCVGNEGLQTDASFFQHGRRLYSAGYGRSFVTSIVPMIHIVNGTEYQFPKYACDNLARHILDGLRYMMHRGYYDYVATGREYVRKDALSARGLIRSAKILCEIEGFERREELIALIESIENGKPTFEGVRYFPVAAYLTMSYNGIYTSFKGLTPALLDAEIINRENQLGYNLSYGTHTTVMVSGKEYDYIAPVWDYSRIPGTTAPHMTDSELVALPSFHNRFINPTDYGGWQDGDVGAIYLTTDHEGISVTAAAFATPYGMIVLGNSISDTQGRELTTTVEQCYAVSEVSSIEGCVLHGDVCYRSLDLNAPLSYSVEEKSGFISRNRPSENDVLHSGRVLTVTASRIKGYASYAYIITHKKYMEHDISVVENNGKRQSVRLPDGRILKARED